MNFKFKIGTKVFFGKECVKENKAVFKDFRKRALLVTGKNSAKASGAFSDVVEVLEEYGIDYEIYDRVANNPSLENVKEGGEAARKFDADFIIGIGGGSPLDASKAVAVLATNDIEPVDLYKNVFENKPLPIIAIPTTAGTGSEVTPYSILTRDDMKTKKSFGNEDTFPAVAFIDARYTESMSYETTVDTALDAFTHALEGYLGRRSTPVSDILAVEAIRIFGECLENLLNNKFDYDVREKLLYMSMLGGMVISHTGTTIIHGMGYSLTYFKDIPHGRANGMLVREYLKYNYEAAKEKTDNVLRLLKVPSIDAFGEIIDRLIPQKPVLTKEEIELYASLAMKQNSTLSNARTVVKEDMEEIFKNTFGKG
ncbi:MAG TPA: alcohol dehydrogenase [Hungateiclostridium thermocellum]|uniref:Iron-containing alcohol dehydrogenase n=1 Tax=Acetivibrio thermocellus (strain ATCC 27405 / DSM 1237 / JCM 9322 / NBRC 103400 / NCIMB 10682 / NRRL B-4536 / VPI 7372) TaxID=203119 RepID=A3DIK0_ACET2|nr:iron-containing alcohol dehydrogenase family protein [Acetivibrio thermocellus]ABN53779.1 iron-containing alcohol dehydrogenase [Acetivibrio thermocellus ATCC 27405]THJ79310.1 iron-containing alcohol dehydrogenase [Acetivibrio thermocellus]HBW25806.1 alcohol dehydrogenase [Acetivibrio thermocellus]HOP93099.1 iron-containing alcohol dehydrogenase family protein [Acetivibrio thermocellus]